MILILMKSPQNRLPVRLSPRYLLQSADGGSHDFDEPKTQIKSAPKLKEESNSNNENDDFETIDDGDQIESIFVNGR